MKTKITCFNCNHTWQTNSTLIKVTCPSCNFKTPNKLKNKRKNEP